MTGESWPSEWTSLRSWFTPTVLFVLLNLVIGTIVLTSKSLRSHRRAAGNETSAEGIQTPLARGPSSIVELLRSFNLYRTGDEGSPKGQPPLARGPSSVLDRLRSISLYRFRSGEIPLPDDSVVYPPSPAGTKPDSPVSEAVPTSPAPGEGGGDELQEDHHQEHHFVRSSSDSREAPAGKLAGRMKKSASESSAFKHFEAAEIVRRPASKRGGRRAALVEEEEEVDARADDFINRFRQQLKLQRLDSILRYKEMLNRSR